MTQDISDSDTSLPEGSHRFLSFIKISSLNLYLFQSYGPVSKFQDTTHRGFRSDLINSENAIEYVLLCSAKGNN